MDAFFRQSENPVFKFNQSGVDGKHLIWFQSENFVLKFLRGSVNDARKQDHIRALLLYTRHCPILC